MTWMPETEKPWVTIVTRSVLSPFLLVAVVRSLGHALLSGTSWTVAHQAPLSSTVSRSLCKFMSIESVCYLTVPSFCHPLLLLPSVSASGSFPVSWLFASSGQSIGASASTSASVLPMNIQDWFPLRLTGLISLLSKGLARIFSSTTIQKLNSSALSLLYGPTLTSIHLASAQ